MTGKERNGTAQPLGDFLAAAFSQFLFPSRCAGCHDARSDFGGGGVCRACWACWATISAYEPSCPRCALPGSGEECRGCLAAPPPVDCSIAVGPYAGTLARIVIAYKFQGYDILARPASRLMAQRVVSAGIETDLVVPVPSTRRRNRERGYDPGELLARGVSRGVGIPMACVLERTRETRPQSSLKASERFENVKGAFRAGSIVKGRRILLVDDVLTTGATSFAAAGSLRDAGARGVDLLVLARTPDPGGDADGRMDVIGPRSFERRAFSPVSMGMRTEHSPLSVRTPGGETA